MKVKINKDIQNQNKSLKQKIDILSNDIKTDKNKLISIQSQKIRINVTKRNLLIHQVMTKNRQKKKKKPKTETETSSDESEEEDTQKIYQLKQKIRTLKHTTMTQTNQIQKLYMEINILQEKEVDHEKSSEDYDKFKRYVKRMTKNNNQVKTAW